MAYGDYVQGTSVDSGSGTTATLAFTSNNTAGNTLVCAVRFGANTGVNPGISDSQGNAWTLVENRQVTSGGETLTLWVCLSCATGANTVTITNSGSITRRWGVAEYAGASTLDQHVSAQGASATPSSGTVTTTTATELIVSNASASGDETFTAGTNFTKRWQVLLKTALEDRVVTSTGTYAGTWTLSASDAWGCAVMTLADAGGGPTGTPPEVITVRSVAVMQAALR